MDTPTIKIRIETPNDYPKVYDLNNKAFGSRKEAQLVDRLRSGKTFINELSLVATIDKQIVGYILFTKVNIVSNGVKHESLALAPMSVDPDFQKKGIGSALVEDGLKRAKELGYRSVLVLGHEDFYPRFNFTPSNRWNIKAPLNIPETSFMGLELVEGGLENINGTVEYPSDFELA